MLNLGLPYREGVQGQVTAEARELLREVADALDAKCPGRPLQINATLGSDYQLVDWLARGSVHMAVLSDLGIHMVQREGVPLVEVVFSNGAPGNWLTPAVPELTAWRVRGHSREAEPDPEARLEDHWRDLLARAMADENARAGMPVRGRLVFRSHLSSVSFLAAVAPTLDWLEERLAGLNEPTAELNEPTAELDEIRERFWDELFRRACFRLSPRLEEGPGCRGFRPEDHWIEIEVIARPLADTTANATRDRLVITAVAAEEIVPTQVPETAASSKPPPRLEPLLWRLPADLRPLFGDSNGDLPRSPVPAFESFLAPNVYFGARTYAFTVDETLRLLELNQLTSARSQLALVLPGGGVKAAYQSRVIDKLYGQEMLVNSGNQQETNAGARQPLVVDYVVGTSGGALLGFFVARLGPRGPFDLSDLLWRPAPPDGGAPDGFLTSTHVFGVTDLPRYISLVTILVVFCAVLALFALRSRGWLAPPERPGEPAPGQPEAPPKSWRGRLTLSILVALVGTPLLVKLVSGGRSLEHVPELEGLLFAVLTVVAMFGDQCLVYGAVESAGGRSSRRLDWARWAGGTLILVPALAALAVRLGERRSERDGELLAPPLEAIRLMLEASATVGGTYLALVLLIGALVFLGARRAGRIRGGEAVRWIGAVALGTALAGWSMTVAPVAALRKLEAVPLLSSASA